MSRRLASIAAIAMFSCLAPLQSANAQKYIVDGIGASRCATIVADYKDRPTAVANDMMGWAYGYMTRRNIERAAAGLSQVNLQPSGFGPAEMVSLMLNFCADNPQVRYYVAVDALFELLREKGVTS